MRKQWKQWSTLFSWAPKSLQIMTAAMKLKAVCSWKKSYAQPRQHIKKQRDYFANKVFLVKALFFVGFSSSHVRMWELDHKESWVPKNFWAVVLEKTLESPLDCKEIKPVNPKGNQSWIFIVRTDAELFGHLMRRTVSLEKTLMLRKIEGKGRSVWQRMRCWVASLTQWI